MSLHHDGRFIGVPPAGRSMPIPGRWNGARLDSSRSGLRSAPPFRKAPISCGSAKITNARSFRMLADISTGRPLADLLSTYMGGAALGGPVKCGASRVRAMAAAHHARSCPGIGSRSRRIAGTRSLAQQSLRAFARPGSVTFARSNRSSTFFCQPLKDE